MVYLSTFFEVYTATQSPDVHLLISQRAGVASSEREECRDALARRHRRGGIERGPAFPPALFIR